MSTILEVSNLSKSYGNVQALSQVSFNIEEGEFYGLLGPNGAGKTTTINIISTISPPDLGYVKINGTDLKTDPMKCKKSIGVVPQEIALYNELSAYENLLFWGGLYKIKSDDIKSKIDSTLKLMGLSDRKNDKIKTYSGGMKRRINIASALLHSPKILFMDEPTVGIDPQSRNLIFEVLEALHKDGMTIIYTTHYMEEAERLCNRIGIIDHGNIIAEGTLDELRNTTNAVESIIIHLEKIEDEEKLDKLGNLIDVSENVLTFSSKNSNKELPAILVDLNKAGLAPIQIEINKVNLETIFLNLTGRKLRD
ncbi:MAG TPA: ABC transporter ATP-binding protein [Ignavibacteriaceae bacterium]|nr:ABC transporter ATP-binding protein [Ignavibacteriaceae bacterium]